MCSTVNNIKLGKDSFKWPLTSPLQSFLEVFKEIVVTTEIKSFKEELKCKKE